MILPKPYYQDEAVTIYHGDCLEIMPHLPPVDAVVTDPPYGISYRSGRSKETREHECSIVGDEDTRLRDAVLDRYAKTLPTACFATIRCTPPFRPKGVLIWDKGPASGMGDFAFPWKPSFEVCWVWGSGWFGSRDGAVLRGGSEPNSSAQGRAHPHQKPVWLLASIIKKAPGSVVLDPFMGSGTTLRAAKDLGRKAIGIEIEEKYCEIAAKRMAQEVLPL